MSTGATASEDARPELAAIWARARGGVIGAGGGMPWHCPADFAFFKEQTLGHPVVMGRTTWESFPERFRPLPGRTNVVLSSSAAPGEHDGALWTPDFSHALETARASRGGAERIWIIGGAAVYAQALAASDLPVAGGRLSRVLVTELDVDVAGDRRAPELGPEWSARELGRGIEERGRVTTASGSLEPRPIPYRFLEHTR